MKLPVCLIALAGGVLATASLAQPPAERLDAIWARTTPDPITLDGVLSEAAWASAESVIVHYGIDAGRPGSGWKVEAGFTPVDSTHAVLKLLVRGNQMYLGATVRDKSIGGHSTFNRFDAFLMSIKDHLDPGSPKPPVEYFYSWWYEGTTDPQPPGQMPIFRGRYGATAPPDTTRTAEAIANWDARITVDGVTNTDASPDVGYVVEMRFNLTPLGYDVTRPEGDVVEWNISIYDCDCFWPLAASCVSGGANFASNRVWYQSPWGNAYWFDEVHVFARPDVTTSSGPVPVVPPEYFIPEVPGPAPAIDGVLSEPVWGSVLSRFDIQYGDNALRQTYPGVGPHRSGQFQPTVNGGQAAVLDPSLADVTVFVKDDWLYLGFDVDDLVVQHHPDFDRWDGFLVTLNEYDTRGPDNNILARRISFQVNSNGTALAQDYLLTLLGSGDAQVALTLKAGTAVDTTGDLDPDTGYQAELAIDLTAMGYPPGLGDQVLWLGVNFLDGDSFSNPGDSYSTRTWWFREYEGQCCPIWAHIIQSTTTGVPDGAGRPPDGYRLLGSYPNPGSSPRIRYVLPEPGAVTFELFDVGGRLVERRRIGPVDRGLQEIGLDGQALSDGLYLYRIAVLDPENGTVRASLFGRQVLVK